MALRRRCGCLAIGIGLLGAALWAAYWYGGRMVEQRIEKAVEARLPSVIGRSGNYSVKASAGLAGAARGRIASVRIEGNNVQLKSGAKLKKLDATLKGITVDPAKRTITRVDSACFHASISGEELNRLLARTYPGIEERAVVLHDGYVTVIARHRSHGTVIKASADAALSIKDGTRIVARILRATSGSISVSDEVRRAIEARMNPVLDASALGFKGRLSTVTIKPDAITISGTGTGADVGL